MRRRLHVELGARSYDVRIGADAAFVARELARLRRPLYVVSDRNVARLVWPALQRALGARRVPVSGPFLIPAGESHKSPATVARLWRTLLDAGADRRACIVALGGGMVGDVAGFTAATFLRGVDWVAVPTTLLAMVDASIGGKVGVNVGGTKNAAGSFHQPRAVLAATGFLRTLPRRERGSGLAEVVKYAMIADAALFRRLEQDARAYRRPRAAPDADLVARCAAVKARYVAADERESGVRAALNFGHTVGHALEGDGRRGLLHGEAVGLGMLAACDIAAAMGVADAGVRPRLHALLARLDLPVEYRRRVPLTTLRRAWQRDKKSRAGVPRFVLTPRIGAVSVGREVPDELIVRALQGILESPPRTRSRARSRTSTRTALLHRSGT